MKTTHATFHNIIMMILFCFYPFNICDLYQRSNRVISDFRVCDSSELDSLHRTYCMHKKHTSVSCGI